MAHKHHQSGALKTAAQQVRACCAPMCDLYEWAIYLLCEVIVLSCVVYVHVWLCASLCICIGFILMKLMSYTLCSTSACAHGVASWICSARSTITMMVKRKMMMSPQSMWTLVERRWWPVCCSSWSLWVMRTCGGAGMWNTLAKVCWSQYLFHASCHDTCHLGQLFSVLLCLCMLLFVSVLIYVYFCVAFHWMNVLWTSCLYVCSVYNYKNYIHTCMNTYVWVFFFLLLFLALNNNLLKKGFIGYSLIGCDVALTSDFLVIF